VPDARLAEVAAVAADAGRIAAEWMLRDYKRWEKAPGNPVCEVDLAIDAFIRPRLEAIDPEAGWLSEETADDPARLGRDRLWVVDPIDGTRDFLRSRPGWAVSIALVDRGRPVLGVLDAPIREEVWLAAAGEGATRNGQAVRVVDRSVFAGTRVPADQLPRVDRDLVTVAKPNSIALRMAMIAAGEADLVATLRWGYEWDIAAAALIVEEAGGVVTDAFGQAIRFNSESAQAFGVVASVPGIHQAALDRLNARASAAVGPREV
jgi:myo-inositol-1(or 4)-monophosphatase